MVPVSNLVVRPARVEDAGAIVSFSAALALETERRALDAERLRQGTLSLLESSAHGFFMVAEAAEQGPPLLVGQLMVTYEWSDWRNAVFWWIQSVYVAPAWRRRGVFRRMHDTVMASAKADPKVCGVRLYVENDNRIAQIVYQRVGMAASAYAVYEQDFVLASQRKLEDRPNEA